MVEGGEGEGGRVLKKKMKASTQMALKKVNEASMHPRARVCGSGGRDY